MYHLRNIDISNPDISAGPGVSLGQPILMAGIQLGPRPRRRIVDEKFNKMLLEAIDDGLMRIGDGIKEALYYHVERKYRIKRIQVPHRLKAFHRALVGLLGAGAEVVEAQIYLSLCDRLGLNLEEDAEGSLVGFVSSVRRLATDNLD